MLSEIERTFTNELTGKVSGLYPLRGTFILWTLEIIGIYKGRRRFALQTPPVVLCILPCNFATFQTAIKSFLFGLRA